MFASHSHGKVASQLLFTLCPCAAVGRVIIPIQVRCPGQRLLKSKSSETIGDASSSLTTHRSTIAAFKKTAGTTRESSWIPMRTHVHLTRTHNYIVEDTRQNQSLDSSAPRAQSRGFLLSQQQLLTMTQLHIIPISYSFTSPSTLTSWTSTCSVQPK
jgi:hypothetical protein